MGEAVTWKFDDTFYPDQGFLCTRTKGTVSYYELLQHPEMFMRYEGFRSGISVLYDFHLVTQVDVDEKLLRDSLSIINCEDFNPQEARTAFVLSTEDDKVMEGVQKICDVLCTSRVEHRAFTSFAEAMAFLQKPLTLIEPLSEAS